MLAHVPPNRLDPLRGRTAGRDDTCARPDRRRGGSAPAVRRPGHVRRGPSGRLPDALAGGAHIAASGGPLLLSATDRVPDDTAAWVAEANLDGGFVYGGTQAISEAVFDRLDALAFD